MRRSAGRSLPSCWPLTASRDSRPAACKCWTAPIEQVAGPAGNACMQPAPPGGGRGGGRLHNGCCLALLRILIGNQPVREHDGALAVLEMRPTPAPPPPQKRRPQKTPATLTSPAASPPAHAFETPGSHRSSQLVSGRVQYTQAASNDGGSSAHYCSAAAGSRRPPWPGEASRHCGCSAGLLRACLTRAAPCRGYDLARSVSRGRAACPAALSRCFWSAACPSSCSSSSRAWRRPGPPQTLARSWTRSRRELSQP